MKTASYLMSLAVLALAGGLVTTPLRADEPKTAPTQRLFATPDEAVKTLLTLTNAADTAAIQAVFGPVVDQLLTGDKVQDAASYSRFFHALAQRCNTTPVGENKVILNIGAENWPFPIPLVKEDGHWRFDTVAGKEEIINRHIGDGELHAIAVCRIYVQAQRQYAAIDRDGSGLLKYARQFKSTPGKQDGLYWKAAPGGESSPLAPLVAEAHAEGYGHKTNTQSLRPYHGYFFKILTEQGPAAPGGKYNYIINGNLIAGFALVAYPEHWGQSGIMTFIVNQQGKVYQRNLGKDTESLAEAMAEFNPDEHWTLVAEPGIVEK
jgi:hypothetical protein